MSISSSAHKPKRGATTASEESAVAPLITLSERSSIGLALLRILVGYLWFQQLFWKLPPTFAGLYGYVVRESQHTMLPGYGALLSFFSVGRPVCNKVVVLLLGVGGAMTLFNPLRPFLGLASIALLSVTLFLRVRALRHGCRLSAQKTIADQKR